MYPAAMTDTSRCLIYGAYGYTGDLIARLAADEGAHPVLAGRDDDKVAALAHELGLEYRVFGLDDPAALDKGLAGIDVVLHCAGPFSRTSRKMTAACLRTNTHYLDITGEFVVFEACAAQGAAAAQAGVMLMPGVGFDVVPSDCLANHLKARLPQATSLTLAFRPVGGQSSHGTATTMVEGLGQPNFVRRDGKIVPVRLGKLSRQVDFGRGPKPCLSIPWGDISTAYHSTGIPNIEVYIGVSASTLKGAWLAGFAGPVMRSGLVRGIAQRRVEGAPAGPSDDVRASAFTLLWGEASAGDERVQARLKVPEGYTLTSRTAWDIAKRTLAGEAQPGFQTPAMVFGADYICGFEGVERTDVGQRA